MSRGGAPRGISAADRRRQAELAAAEARRRRQFFVMLGSVLAVVALVVGGSLGWNLYTIHRAPVATSAPPDPGTPVPPVAGQPLRVGRPDAAHVVALYEDAHCPGCAALEERIGETLTAAVRDGRARLELYPLSFLGDGSARAAAGQACAADAGVLLSFHAGLWANHRAAWAASQVEALARATGGERGDAVAACAREGRHADWAAGLDAVASANGVVGTPTLLMDGVAQDVTSMDSHRLEELLR